MQPYFLTWAFCLLNFWAVAQSTGVFSLPYEGEEIFVTQAIPNQFLGTYAENSLQCNISKNFGSSYLISPKTSGEKDEIIWGVLVEDDQLLTTQVTEIREGKKINYEAYVLILHNPIRNYSEEWMLYKLNGKYHFGKAEKMDAVAANK